MARVEAADARPEEAPDARPLARGEPPERRQPDRRVEAPGQARRRQRRHTELERGDAPAGPHDPRQLAQRRGGILDVAQQVGEGQRVEARVRERQRLGLARARGCTLGLRPCREALRARASIAALWSMPTTVQSARPSSSAATIPVPVATSSTRSPRRGAISPTSARRQRGSCQKLSAADSSS